MKFQLGFICVVAFAFGLAHANYLDSYRGRGSRGVVSRRVVDRLDRLDRFGADNYISDNLLGRLGSGRLRPFNVNGRRGRNFGRFDDGGFDRFDRFDRVSGGRLGLDRGFPRRNVGGYAGVHTSSFRRSGLSY